MQAGTRALVRHTLAQSAITWRGRSTFITTAQTKKMAAVHVARIVAVELLLPPMGLQDLFWLIEAIWPIEVMSMSDHVQQSATRNAGA